MMDVQPAIQSVFGVPQPDGCWAQAFAPISVAAATAARQKERSLALIRTVRPAGMDTPFVAPAPALVHRLAAPRA